ncbi:F-BAR and double SH3 domains protein 2 isoform X2 [Lates calcarifer]|uniref:F-BAR and double SH3 domains protein 2 isoform X2 n=1 Tax=Lates calcarifer TaxID=8187 RepID=A0AAJ7LEM5_LATCA|nr:F-BAR and double SH3 domains protein 2 isoform X2 [Lates calcarifer]
MQPPPRKVKESQQVKLVFSEQLSKLQTKQHQDTELLEEIRSFSKHRAAIEKEYGQRMDGDIYDALRSHLTLLCGTEMDTNLSTHKQYSKIWDSVIKVTREKNIQQFLQESVSFSKSTEFTLQPAPRDKVSSLQEVCALQAEGCLVKEAKKWATKAAKDYKIITHGERALQMLESRLKLLSGETGLSVEQKITEVQDSVRKALLSRVKAEARLALLSHTVTGTELWLHNAMNQAEEELESERRLSEQRKSTEDFSEDEFDLTDFEDYDDENGDIFADPVSASGVFVYPAACRVIYGYQACQSDELSIMEGEELQVIEDGDMEDWLKVCNSCGQVGYVPERYVQFLCLPAEDAAQLDSSFSSTSSTCNKEKAGSRGVVRALYSYQAQSAEELSFQEGALIHLIRCRHGEVDDGFWEGELNGQIGVFPSLVVELIHDEGEEEKQEEEPLPTPTMPPYSPPIPILSPPSCSSALSATPPSCMTDKQQVFPPKLTDNTGDPGGNNHKSPDLSSSRLRPCRAPPPPPPTQKPSPQP